LAAQLFQAVPMIPVDRKSWALKYEILRFTQDDKKRLYFSFPSCTWERFLNEFNPLAPSSKPPLMEIALNLCFTEQSDILFLLENYSGKGCGWAWRICKWSIWTD
jgi:hypothetical protein